jgi:uncharacterized protein (TIGR00255 family)
VASPVLLSMTGFGLGEASCERGRLRVEVRAVNHRSLDVRVRVPPELADLARIVEDAVRSTVGRGRVEVQVAWHGMDSAARGPGLAELHAAHALLVAFRDAACPGDPVSLDAVVRLATQPSRAEPSAQNDSVATCLRTATEGALAALKSMRGVEGASLARDLAARVSLLREHARALDQARPAQLEAYRERVLARVHRMLDGSGVEVDPTRLAHEVAWMAERSDVAEELTRLASHLAQFESALTDDTHVGRRLEFLVQELGREVNTLGSKAGEADVAQRVIAMKAELDRIREQVANVL